MHTSNRPAEPRCMTQIEAAAYCRLTPAGFMAWQRQGLVPGPISGTRRWDKHALDAALNKVSGLDPVATKTTAVEDWFQKNAHTA